MPLTREDLEAAVDRFNESVEPDREAAIVTHEGDRFEVLFPVPGRSAPVHDEHFSDVQVELKEVTGLDSEIHGGFYSEAHEGFVLMYEVVRWDEP